MADVTGNSNEEIIVAGEGGVAVLDAIDGHIVWSRSVTGADSATQFELADLDNDGEFEILVSTGQTTPARVTAFHGDGSLYWTSATLGGTSPSDLVVFDIDGDGYPNVFIATMWTASSNNDGKLTELNGRTGAIVRQVWCWHPCAGGLSIADGDNDGEFELYLCDRNDNYGDAYSRAGSSRAIAMEISMVMVCSLAGRET